VLLIHLATLQSTRFGCISDKKTGTFVKAEHRIGWVKGQAVEPQNLFHLRQEVDIELAQSPRALEVWLHFVFFRIVVTYVCEMLSQKSSSTLCVCTCLASLPRWHSSSADDRPHFATSRFGRGPVRLTLVPARARPLFGSKSERCGILTRLALVRDRRGQAPYNSAGLVYLHLVHF
jgi:hypothetical protein